MKTENEKRTGMMKACTKDYMERLNAAADFVRETPADKLPKNWRIAKKFNIAGDSVLRVHYMVANNCDAVEAIQAIDLRSTKKDRVDHTSWAKESLCGETTLQTLMRSWRAA
jgi:hypothetical protein